MVAFKKAVFVSGISALAVGAVHWLGHRVGGSTGEVGLMVVGAVFLIGLFGMGASR